MKAKGNREKSNFRKFLMLWAGELVSAVGSGLTSFAIGVYVYQLTGKASAMAMISLIAFLPPLLLSPFAGVLADRYDRRLLMILGDGLSAVGLVFILYCLWDGQAEFWQICVGIGISSVFSALLEPAYKATVTDLLTEEEYAKASGLVQMAGSAKYLISPFLAGFLLAYGSMKLILVLDISTFFLTVAVIIVIRKGMKQTNKYNKEKTQKFSFFADLKEGIGAISEVRGVWTLIFMSAVLTFFLAVIQTLAAPMVLAFSDSKVLGIVETVSATGMLVAGLLIGMSDIKKGYVKMLSFSLLGAGIFMAGFGARENIYIITVFGFLFFSMLPFANMSMDCLVRRNIANEKQGRVWGIIGILSQLGYVVAYAGCGFVADYIFTPLMMPEGALANSMGRILGTGSGRGIGLLIILAGIFVSVLGIMVYQIKSIHELEENVCLEES